MLAAIPLLALFPLLARFPCFRCRIAALPGCCGLVAELLGCCCVAELLLRCWITAVGSLGCRVAGSLPPTSVVGRLVRNDVRETGIASAVESLRLPVVPPVAEPG
ncbi:MAG TPA: hypothetical protein VFG87_16510 [Amycolatopsis sp.]|nr:hypothetical protein [Amycolatopsis sp.]